MFASGPKQTSQPTALVSAVDPIRTLSSALTLPRAARDSQKIPAPGVSTLFGSNRFSPPRNAARSPRRSALATAPPTRSDNEADRLACSDDGRNFEAPNSEEVILVRQNVCNASIPLPRRSLR